MMISFQPLASAAWRPSQPEEGGSRPRRWRGPGVRSVARIPFSPFRRAGELGPIGSCDKAPLWQGDQRDLPAISGLAAMGGAAIAEEAVGIGIGVEPERFGPADAGRGEARGDIGLEVELVVPVPAGTEETVVGGIGVGEAAVEGLVDFVAAPRDRRADRGGDPAAL